MKYNKLVRDKIAEILRLKEIIHSTHIADDKEYFEKLKEKYIEETKEFIESDDKVELADILEVTYTFRDYLKIDYELLEDLSKKTEYNHNKFIKRVKSFVENPNAKKLGNILGMIYSACDELKISKEELESIRQVKAETKGKFLEKIILEEIKE